MNFKSIKISKQIELALRWLLFLAQNKTSDFINLRSFCNEKRVSFYHLQKINRQLVKAGLIESQKGKTGGYRLKKSPQQISLLSIIETLEGPISLVYCSPFCTSQTCALKNCWQTLNKDLAKKLAKIKLNQFLK
ncbi:MAG: Rrf2 family transcriptional regulator [Patescibacteria group bacterium]|jgi:Rrf2 family protein|nr:Rrf2 family transcriptional regulator [Patescibacteria group bacterium]